MKTIIQNMATAALLFTLIQCGGGSGGACETALDVAGTWNTDFTCTGPAGNGTDTLTVTQDGTEVSFTNTLDGATFTGDLCGTTFTWTGGLTGSYTESGTWEFSSDSAITKDTSYTNANGGGSGTCTGSGTKQ